MRPTAPIETTFNGYARVNRTGSDGRKPLWLAAAIAMTVCVFAPAAGAAELVPHSAYYKYSLESARSGSGIANVGGDMAIDWDQSCEGWTLTQKSLLNLFNAQGRQIRSLATTLSTWESADGRDYRFSVKNITDRKHTVSIEGQARLPKPGAAGWAEFSVPKKRRIALPAGTLFPTRHTVVVLNALKRAPTIISKKVFDGMTLDGLLEISAVIGRPLKTGASQPQLAKIRSWPVQLAFFSLKGAKAEPDHEVGMRIYQNGVGDTMVLDFASFKVRATMKRLNMGVRSVCK